MDIPERLKSRPRWGELPIPYTTMIVEGKPDFRVADGEAWARCVRGRLCALCGQALGYYVWFIGGPLCYRHRFFFDPAMHEECARYALAVCPFLAGDRQYSGRELPGGATVVKGVSRQVPDRIALMQTRSYSLVRVSGVRQVRAEAFTKVEWFEHGSPVSLDNG
jgi:hypothetical protein